MQVRSGAGAATSALFVTSVFTGAAVLFVVEPMVAKMLLPLAGGTAAVWTTSVLFFQLLLGAGYAYAHWLSRRLSPRAQFFTHLTLMAAVLALLPITLRQPGPPPGGDTPIYWLLGVLVLSAGLPFFVVSTTSPLLQRWISMSSHPLAADPYPLYRASNLGSLAALLAYPAVIELRLGLGDQQRYWTGAYLALVLLTALCGRHLWSAPHHRVLPGSEPAAPPARVSRARLARWVLLAAVPSTWMLGVTSYFTTAIRPLPLLWVVPLGIYLLSFAIVFGRRPPPPRLLHRAFPFLALPLLGFTVLGGRGPFWFLALFHLGTFLVGAVICHGLLAADRPPPADLTRFYLWLSLGGALGGVLAAVVAPLLFNDYFEYPLAIVAACFLRPGLRAAWSRRSVALDVGAGAVLLAALLLVFGVGVASGVFAALGRIQLSAGASAADLARILLVFAIPAVVAVAVSASQVRFGSVAAVMVLLGLLPIGSQAAVLFQSRDFYGVHAVVADAAGTRHLLIDGVTIHGVQMNDPALRDLPAAYYAPSGPAGDLFRAEAARSGAWRIGVVGLGSGALSCYARPAQRWTYFELDPEVERIARDPRLFTYLRDCTGEATRVVIGDGRLSIAADRGTEFNLLVFDAFGSDAVPTHLLTTEAIRLYLDHLAPDGILLFNVSNKYLDLSSVLAAEATSLGLQALEKVDPSISAEQAAIGKFPSDWLVLAPSGANLDALRATGGWLRPQPLPGQVAWTDDYSDVLVVTRFS